MGISLSGLASGLDTNAMIEGLMKLERLPLTNLQAQKTDLGNQTALMRSLNTKLTALKTAVADLTYQASFNIVGGVSSNKDIVDIKTTDSAAKGTYSVKVTSLASAHVIKSGEFEASKTDLVVAGAKVTIKGEEIELRGNNNEEILKNLVDDIKNNDALSGISASLINSKSGHLTLSITANDLGEDNKITFDNLSGGLGLTEAVPASNAVFTVNGVKIERSSNEISDAIEGITFNLKASQGESTITIKQDNDKIADKIEAFVKAYNDVATLIHDNTGKGKLLQSNSTVRNIDMQLKEMIGGLYSDTGSIRMLSDIGIEIDKGITNKDNMTGKITFDKDKLLAKLSEDPKAVMDLFNGEKTVTLGGTTSVAKGMAIQLNDLVGVWTNSTEGLLTVAIKGFESNIGIVDENIERLSARLERREESLRKQFAAMEVALTTLKSQQNWLAGQISQLTAAASAK